MPTPAEEWSGAAITEVTDLGHNVGVVVAGLGEPGNTSEWPAITENENE